MIEIADNGIASAALQRIIESTHSLQTRVFRATLRRKMNGLAVDELSREVSAMESAIADLRDLLSGGEKVAVSR